MIQIQIQPTIDSKKEVGKIMPRVSPFNALPEDIISTVVSSTSPRDACIAATVSKTFKSAVQSDNVWEKFLPAEYASLILPSRVFSWKKELYFALCSPVLIEDGQKSFWLDKPSGKSCIMLSMRQFSVTWGATPHHWRWISIPEARFDQVPELLKVCAFEIRGTMNTRILSSRTRYSAYIVYKTRSGYRGLKDLAIQVGVGLVGRKTPKRIICIDMCNDRKNHMIESDEREDGWIEAKLGEFINEGDGHEIALSIVDMTSPYWKSGLIIQGIEFRPQVK